MPTSYVIPKAQQQKPPPGTMVDLEHPMGRGIVGCWLFNEAAGSRCNDLSGNNNNLTTVNAGKFVPSSLGIGMSCVGNDAGAVLSVTSATNPILVTGPLTLVWDGIPFSAPANNSWIGGITYDGSSSSPYDACDFVYTNSGFFAFSIAIGGVAKQLSSFMTNGIRNQLVGTYTSGSQVLYINSVPVASGSPTGSVGYGTNPYLGVGKQGNTRNPNTFANSLIIYNRALSPLEVQQIYAAPYCMFLPTGIRRFYSENIAVLPKYASSFII